MSIRKILHVILSEAKNLCEPFNYEILRRLAPQNDIQEQRFRRETNEFRFEHSRIRILNLFRVSCFEFRVCLQGELDSSFSQEIVEVKDP